MGQHPFIRAQETQPCQDLLHRPAGLRMYAQATALSPSRLRPQLPQKGSIPAVAAGC